MKKNIWLFIILSIFFVGCKKQAKTLTGDWQLTNTYVNGSLQPSSDTCMLFTVNRNKDQFFLKRYSCSTNASISLASGEWELTNKKKTIKMNFLQSSIPNPQNSGIWNWDIKELSEDNLTVEYSSFNKVKYEFKRL